MDLKNKTEFTQKEKLEIEKFKNEWLKIGLKTGKSNAIEKKECENAISDFYVYGKQEKPKNFIWVDSPLEAEILIENFELLAGNKKEVKDVLFELKKQKKNLKRKFVQTNFWGQQDGYWITFYLFGKKLGCKYPEKELKQLLGFEKIAKACMWWYPFSETCIISERPKELYLNKSLQLHSDGKPAISFFDDFKLWFLNGIKVTQEIAETPSEKLKPELALNEKNTDVQREVIRKIGYDRMLKACNAKTLEFWVDPKTKLEYTLRHMKIGEIDRRYLCYEHASMPGIFYAKCIPPEALNIIQMRGFQTGVVSREDLRVKKYSDSEILAQLPETVQ